MTASHLAGSEAPDTAASTSALPTSGLPVARVRVPVRTSTNEFRAVKIVWQRELIRFSTDRLRMITSLVQPFLFLFVLGS